MKSPKKKTMDAEGKLNSLVTEPTICEAKCTTVLHISIPPGSFSFQTIPINMKGKNQFEVESYHRFINTAKYCKGLYCFC